MTVYCAADGLSVVIISTPEYSQNNALFAAIDLNDAVRSFLNQTNDRDYMNLTEDQASVYGKDQLELNTIVKEIMIDW